MRPLRLKRVWADADQVPEGHQLAGREAADAHRQVNTCRSWDEVAEATIKAHLPAVARGEVAIEVPWDVAAGHECADEVLP